jgi:antitoxin component YwqK of YwqJK toxin-antitoxin module
VRILKLLLSGYFLLLLANEKERIMLLKNILLVLVAISLFACSPQKTDKEQFTIKNNIIYSSGSNTPYTGIVKAKAEGKVFEYYVKDGLKNGEFKASFSNGHLIMKGNIINDKNEGKWVYYYPFGELETEGNFKSNKADSIWTWYYPGGKVKEKGLFVNGLREGNWKMFDESGNILMDNIYKNDIIAVSDKK